jgi:hypothetical protein
MHSIYIYTRLSKLLCWRSVAVHNHVIATTRVHDNGLTARLLNALLSSCLRVEVQIVHYCATQPAGRRVLRLCGALYAVH